MELETASALSHRRECRAQSWSRSLVGVALVGSLTLNAALLCRLEGTPKAILSSSLAGDSVGWATALARLGGSEGDTADWRRLANSSLSSASSSPSAASGASGSSGGAGEHLEHPHDTLIFLFIMLMTGTLVMHLSFVPCLHNMQQTVVLFVIGVVYSWIQEAGLKDVTGQFGLSYEMWMGIDPHLLLFMLLPLLLTGDAMTIDTSVAKRVAMQCLYLAGPGVLINAMLAAGFLSFYLGWPFLMSLTTGAILCATDPVAVVALLKELGASPTLTVQIQGESLLNDGTAIVLYTVAYQMLSGKSFDLSEIGMFLVMTVCMAWGVGMLVGYVFYMWIRLANRRLEHSASSIQIILTLCCAYSSFIIAEGLLHISGVLSTVAAALVLAHHMWPHVTSLETMHHVWHTFETLGNIIIFFLAGALVGKSMLVIDWADYGHLIVIYLVLLFIRGAFIYASRPLLRWLHDDKAEVPYSACAIMTWGGLRGAVGLALAIQVNLGRAMGDDGEERISQKNADRVLFFVGGIAFLTTIVNATTCPHLVAYLKITALPSARLQLLKLLHRRLCNRLSKDLSPNVHGSLQRILDEAEYHMLHEAEETTASASAAVVSAKNRELIVDTTAARMRFLDYSDEEMVIVSALPEVPLVRSQVFQRSVDALSSSAVDGDVSKVVNETFLNLVRSQYMTRISNGSLCPGSKEATCLLTSIQLALSNAKTEVSDFQYIEAQCSQVNFKRKTKPPPKYRGLKKFVDSSFFAVVMASTILFNGIYVLVEENVRSIEDKSLGWLVVEIVFTLIFTIEMLLKLIVERHRYFMDAWNVFDAFLVTSGIFGVVIAIISNSSADSAAGTSVTEQARLIRVSKVFRVMRLLRLFRLIRFIREVKAKLKHQTLSYEMADHMYRMTLLQNFAMGHARAQEAMLTFFGEPGASCPELAQCLLTSLQSVLQSVANMQAEVDRYEAQAPTRLTRLITSSTTTPTIPTPSFSAVDSVQQSKRVCEEFESFIMDALSAGAVNAREAESLLHSMHGHIKECMTLIAETNNGVVQDIDELLSSGRRSSHLRSSLSHLRSSLGGHRRSDGNCSSNGRERSSGHSSVNGTLHSTDPKPPVPECWTPISPVQPPGCLS
eukprot:TRINITY_DN19542_c1_g1_i1.p1 TRINITY_DN19542_c1_g1~~TRINITY_DN19542_c1_g1_i1.p1  ORF type:complete len:1136 (+),score=198.70 TRINITY_DN19542_c1_g1_i1:54-3410(+)